jgi:teichuronic acid biosynthesis glycosyltransferase TuaG
MKTKPLVSIIITYYKKKRFIKKTLNSLLDQNYKNYELIFIYDDENLEDLSTIKILLSKFKSKKIIINKKNLGVAKSRNIAIKYSQGKYLAFIDADDIWKKNKLKVQINFMIKFQSNFSFTSYAVIGKNSRLIKIRKVDSDPNYENLSKSNIIGLSTVIVSKKLINKMKFPNLKTQEDFALWLSLLRQGVKLHHINKVLSYWRQTDNSLSSNVLDKLFDAFKMFYKYEKKNLLSALISVFIISYKKVIKDIL